MTNAENVRQPFGIPHSAFGIDSNMITQSTPRVGIL